MITRANNPQRPTEWASASDRNQKENNTMNRMHIIDRLVDDRSVETMKDAREALILLAGGLAKILDEINYGAANIDDCKDFATEALRKLNRHEF